MGQGVRAAVEGGHPSRISAREFWWSICCLTDGRTDTFCARCRCAIVYWYTATRAISALDIGFRMARVSHVFSPELGGWRVHASQHVHTVKYIAFSAEQARWHAATWNGRSSSCFSVGSIHGSSQAMKLATALRHIALLVMGEPTRLLRTTPSVGETPCDTWEVDMRDYLHMLAQRMERLLFSSDACACIHRVKN